MIETTKDIMFIVISVAVAAFVFFICWFFYYLISTIKNIRRIVLSFKERLDKIDEIIKTAKVKVDSSGTQVAYLFEGVKQLIKFFEERKKKRGKK